MTSPDPVSVPPNTSARRHVRIRAVPLRPTKYPVHASFRLADLRPVHLAAKQQGVSTREFMRRAVMRAAADTLARPRRSA